MLSSNMLNRARRTIIIENNYSGQFARYLRSETSFVPSTATFANMTASPLCRTTSSKP